MAAGSYHKRNYWTIVKAFLIVFLSDAVWAAAEGTAEPVVSVGKLRASADQAFTKGEIDQSLKLWEKVACRIVVL